MSETRSLPGNPLDMAKNLRNTRGIGAVASRAHNPTTPRPEAPDPSEVVGPFEGKTIERNGQKLRYTKVPTGRTTWDRETGQQAPEYYSLKTWFSHFTTGLGPGPGWDSRLGLPELSPYEMTEQYGHVFTKDEIFAPGGKRDFTTDKLVGGMPENIPYYTLVPLNENGSASASVWG